MPVVVSRPIYHLRAWTEENQAKGLEMRLVHIGSDRWMRVFHTSDFVENSGTIVGNTMVSAFVSDQSSLCGTMLSDGIMVLVANLLQVLHNAAQEPNSGRGAHADRCGEPKKRRNASRINRQEMGF